MTTLSGITMPDGEATYRTDILVMAVPQSNAQIDSVTYTINGGAEIEIPVDVYMPNVYIVPGNVIVGDVVVTI